MRGIAIIVPTWNRAGLLAQALESLRNQTHPVDRVIVVDNGSTDDAVEVATRAGAQVISLPANAGFAAAVNRGIREAAGSEWIGVLNNDVTPGAGLVGTSVGETGTSLVCDRQASGRPGARPD